MKEAVLDKIIMNHRKENKWKRGYGGHVRPEYKKKIIINQD